MIHPTLAAAADGTLPAWAEATGARRAHMARVAELMERWAMDLDLSDDDAARWRATAFLHDALRDADPDTLRSWVGPRFDDAPDPLLHGPAAAGRLEAEGVHDPPLLLAIAYHTLGHPDLGRLGRALYIADHVEPGRNHDAPRLAELRRRMPDAMDGVVRDVAAARISHAVSRGIPLHPMTVAWWNRLAGAAPAPTPTPTSGGDHG